MPRHKFAVGSHVDFRQPYGQMPASGGRFVVQRQLPPDDLGSNQYRIESAVNGLLRVAHEAELSAAGLES